MTSGLSLINCLSLTNPPSLLVWPSVLGNTETGLEVGLVGLEVGLVGLEVGLVGLEVGLVGLEVGLVGLEVGLVGLEAGLVGMVGLLVANFSDWGPLGAYLSDCTLIMVPAFTAQALLLKRVRGSPISSICQDRLQPTHTFGGHYACIGGFPSRGHYIT